MLIPIIIALFVAGGTSIAAENALPGEFLYPVKVDVNEKVFDLVSITSKAQATADLSHAQERLQEAEKLAAGKHLDAKTSAELNVRLKAHIENLNTQTMKMEAAQDSTDALTAHSDLEATLKAHGLILKSIKGEDAEEQDAIDSIRGVVGEEADGAEKDRADSEEKVSADQGGDVKGAAEGKLKAAENKIAEVRGFIENKKASSTAQVLASAEAQIKLAEDKVAAGKVSLAAEAYGDAFNDFQSALRTAQEAKLVGEAEDELDIDVEDNDEAEVSDDSTTENGEGKDEKMTDEKKGGSGESKSEGKSGARIQSSTNINGAGMETSGDGSDEGGEGNGSVKVDTTR